MNKPRLLRLVQLLRAPLPDELSGFSMSFFRTNVDLNDFGADNAVWRPGFNCGTVCCALGLAALDPEFQTAGLHLSGGNVYFENSNSYDAGAEFFEIPIDHAERIFYPDDDLYGPRPHRPETVADVIERYVETGVLP
ncbi:hypothetical protein [Inquilinus limosus]|uniref:Uncharacterized protein n=1 Tax=Inquilinus limosus MP06 TaxID=1398085 RepID=A0A0A0DBS5_9PROT|nr:hypothetical protein [Inquilinus limosus]KGM36166.1 hypothetical protein P409_00530 [Inquilinus limosus MP06]